VNIITIHENVNRIGGKVILKEMCNFFFLTGFFVIFCDLICMKCSCSVENVLLWDVCGALSCDVTPSLCLHPHPGIIIRGRWRPRMQCNSSLNHLKNAVQWVGSSSCVRRCDGGSLPWSHVTARWTWGLGHREPYIFCFFTPFNNILRWFCSV